MNNERFQIVCKECLLKKVGLKSPISFTPPNSIGKNEFITAS